MMQQLKIGNIVTPRDEASLRIYLVEISREPMITVDEEIDLAQEIHKGGRKGERAKTKLIKANLRFAVSVAKQYLHQGLSLVDLISEGNIGLIKAAGKFDETRGFKFISYAVWWIRQSILQAIEINQVTSEFVQLYNRRPSIHELSKLTGINEARIRQSQNADKLHMSTDTLFRDDDDNSMPDILSNRDDSQMDFKPIGDDLKAMLRKTLKEREIIILTEYFGIGCHKKGLEEIGTEMGLTCERVLQIHKKAIEKIRESGNAQVLRKYLG